MGGGGGGGGRGGGANPGVNGLGTLWEVPVGKQDFQGGGNRDNLGITLQHCVIFCNRNRQKDAGTWKWFGKWVAHTFPAAPSPLPRIVIITL